MKKFIAENWYKLMIGSSLFMASFGFMIYSITIANAKNLNKIPANSSYWMVPVNADGSISVKLSDEQLKALAPNAVQSVNIAEINGYAAAAYKAYTTEGKEFVSLAVWDVSE